MTCCVRKGRTRVKESSEASNAAAFEQLYLDHEPELYEYLARRLESEAAEDTVADVFALAWQRFPNRDGRLAVRTWLLGLALERLETRRDDELECLEHLAARGPAHAPPSPCPHVAHALAQLDPIDRDMLTLHLWADVSHESVAVLTGLPPATVHDRIDRAIAHVRGHARGDDPAAAR